ncbi:hypothetical protein NDU88_000438 [Pleurodeles waltl]|uniref:Uncharacterized protein n=1 Tax=Pleurodeles waltl TaxID=8319 RepID=A0AAV7TF07_PLEWA|nr:hypothetical protein NDU88_000438 [Pleurodeles waltl]
MDLIHPNSPHFWGEWRLWGSVYLEIARTGRRNIQRCLGARTTKEEMACCDYLKPGVPRDHCEFTAAIIDYLEVWREWERAAATETGDFFPFNEKIQTHSHERDLTGREGFILAAPRDRIESA